VAVIFPFEIWLLDFKTDDVNAETIGAKAREYRTQLIAYAAALERIYQRPVTNRWLHFLAMRQTVGKVDSY
jgi:ATP-dependent exoDNAse (exonuclease V) beta subunit